MSINATVTLSISELDVLRDQIKTLTADKEQLLDREKSLIIKVVEHNFSNQSLPERRYVGYGIYESILVKKEVTNTIESYKNLDDILDTLRNEASKGMEKELSRLNTQISSKNSKIAELEKQLSEKHDEIHALKTNQEHKTLEEKYKELELINDRLSSVETCNIELSKDNSRLITQTSVLNDSIQNLRNRKWYHLLFNIK